MPNWGTATKKLLGILKRAKPDLIAITGDLIDLAGLTSLWP